MQELTLWGRLEPCAMHGANALMRCLQAKPVKKPVYAGTLSGSGEMREAVLRGDVHVPESRESFGIGATADAIYVAGRDDARLMYGCFSLMEQLEQGKEPFSTQESPFLETRGIYELPHNRDLEEERFYSKTYWTEYFDMLARNRINQFNYVFSHQTGYMAPVFAYFLRDEKYPQAKPVDIPPEMVDKNYEIMDFITKLAYARGISFILGIWEIYPWRGGEGDWRPTQPNGVPGVTEDILEDYIYRGAKAMLTQFPHIDGIQVRVNEESSIPASKQTAFFENTIFRAVAETGRLMDYRGWLALPETTAKVKEMCPDLRASMKYWAEFLGAPYQPAKIEPGYSYGDLLEKPMPYRFMWQVWSLGSPRLLLWGDPEYVRRFVESCKLGGAEGFEINPHLAQKGYGNDPGVWRIFQNKDDEYFTHEYERYWMFYLLFGRLAYNPDAASGLWMDTLTQRVGNAAPSLMTAYQLSSRVITFLVQYSLSDPNMYIWPEIDLGGMLEFYLETPTSDSCVLATVPEFIRNLRQGTACGKFTPRQTADLFRAYGEGILRALSDIETDKYNKELFSSVLDFTIMAHLAMYHADKITAAIATEAYFQTGDGSALYQAQDALRNATTRWDQIIAVSGDFYYDHMVTGPSDAGSWKAKRRMAYEDELRLAEIVRIHEKYGVFMKAFDFGGDVTMEGFENRPFELFKTFSVEKRFEGVRADSRFTPESGFGFVRGQALDKAICRPRLTDRTADWKYRRDALYDVRLDNLAAYRAPLLEDYVYGEGEAEFVCAVEDGEYSVTLVFADEHKDAKCHGPFSASLNGVEFCANRTTLPLENFTVTKEVAAKDGKLQLRLSGSYFISALIIRRKAPGIAHMPPRALSEGELLRVTATSPGQQALTVRARLGEQEIPMIYDGYGHYHADVFPLLPPGAPVRYQIFASDGKAESASEPATLTRKGAEQFSLRHEAPRIAAAGQSLPISITAEPGQSIAEIRLMYSRCNQYDALESVTMRPEGNEYRADIPGGYILPTRDLLYYFEVLGSDGLGAVFPDFRERTPYYVVEIQPEA